MSLRTERWIALYIFSVLCYALAWLALTGSRQLEDASAAMLGAGITLIADHWLLPWVIDRSNAARRHRLRRRHREAHS